MASYAIIRGNETGGTGDDILALVVTDGETTIVVEPPGGTDVGSSLTDTEWPTGAEDDVLTAGLHGLTYYTIDGPHRFEGSAVDSAPPLAASYGLAD